MSIRLGERPSISSGYNKELRLVGASPIWFGFSIWYSVSSGSFVYYVGKLIDRKEPFFIGSSIACGAAQI